MDSRGGILLNLFLQFLLLNIVLQSLSHRSTAQCLLCSAIHRSAQRRGSESSPTLAKCCSPKSVFFSRPSRDRPSSLFALRPALPNLPHPSPPRIRRRSAVLPPHAPVLIAKSHTLQNLQSGRLLPSLPFARRNGISPAPLIGASRPGWRDTGDKSRAEISGFLKDSSLRLYSTRMAATRPAFRHALSSESTVTTKSFNSFRSDQPLIPSPDEEKFEIHLESLPSPPLTFTRRDVVRPPMDGGVHAWRFCALALCLEILVSSFERRIWLRVIFVCELRADFLALDLGTDFFLRFVPSAPPSSS